MTEELKNNRLIRSNDVRALCGGVSDMWIWRRLYDKQTRNETFRKPVYISKRRFWRKADVLDWLEQQADQSATTAQ